MRTFWYKPQEILFARGADLLFCAGMLDDLYQQIILDHYRRPRNKGRTVPADFSARENNPLCGDEIEITGRVHDGRIAEIRFEGHGCAISQASASILTTKLVGKTLPEAEQVITTFLRMMRGDPPTNPKELGDARALEGVLKFPVRVKCATLAWHTAQAGLDQVKAKTQ